MPLKVSIIIPIYNAVNYIEFTLKSIMNQSFTNYEVIIVDDCSTDGSLDVIYRFSDCDSRIKVILLDENSGPAVARNAAIKAANGRYIAFLDADDLWFPKKLEKQLAFMDANNYPFSYSAYEKIDEKGQVYGHIGVPDKLCYSDLLKTCAIGCLTAIYDTEFFGKVYFPTNTKREDFALWLQLLKRVYNAYGLNETLAQYRVYKNQSSGKKMKMAKENWRLYREIEGLNIIKASYYFAHYMVRGVLRAKAPSLARLFGVLK